MDRSTHPASIGLDIPFQIRPILAVLVVGFPARRPPFPRCHRFEGLVSPLVRFPGLIRASHEYLTSELFRSESGLGFALPLPPYHGRRHPDLLAVPDDMYIPVFLQGSSLFCGDAIRGHI